MQLKIPAFGEETFYQTAQTATSEVTILPGADEGAFEAYCRYFTDCGFTKSEAYETSARRFAAFRGEGMEVFLNYYPSIREMTVVTETACGYFDYTDTPRNRTVTPQITQLHLEDFGLSYVIRLSDGRFIVFDGGFDFKPDRDRLMACLREGAPGEKPVIAAWIMTHPHCDHFYCFNGFMDDYAHEVIIEKFLFHFPEAEDFAHYPGLDYIDPRIENFPEPYRAIRMMRERIAAAGARIHITHTGQRYRIGDAFCEILSSMDDTIHCSDNINATSLVIRMELAGQVILWTADASFSIGRIPERYGRYLRADILQVPHHGFQSGTAEGEIAGYDLIRPAVCLLPVADYHTYNSFCTFKAGTRYLMTSAGVAEMITGTTQRTLSLPYTPPAYGRQALADSYRAGRESCGAHTWIFSGLSTACGEDLRFAVTNMTYLKATLAIDIFFEDPTRNVSRIAAEVERNRVKTLCISDPADVDGDALFFNDMALAKRGIPENAAFTVRFISDIPVVVSNRNHAPTYHSAYTP